MLLLKQIQLITTNSAKISYTAADVVAVNTAKVGFPDALVAANAVVTANKTKVGFTDALVEAYYCY